MMQNIKGGIMMDRRNFLKIAGGAMLGMAFFKMNGNSAAQGKDTLADGRRSDVFFTKY